MWRFGLLSILLTGNCIAHAASTLTLEGKILFFGTIVEAPCELKSQTVPMDYSSEQTIAILSNECLRDQKIGTHSLPTFRMSEYTPKNMTSEDAHHYQFIVTQYL